MPDIFISYSRKNQPFIRKLAERLMAQKRDVWVDFEDIPWTADWWREIREGIEQSHTIIFALSPASLSSVVCTLELDYAIQNNKRIIPIVVENANQDAALETLAATPLDDVALEMLKGRDIVQLARNNWRFIAQHNWMFANDDSRFEAFVADLAGAVDTDLEYIEGHTQVLTRALEWDSHQRESSFLLHGTEITQSENWLSKSGNKNPLPTQLHTEYIYESRRRASRTQRNLLVGVSVALLVTLVLAILSVLLWQQASVERDRANLQARISESGRVALQGLLELDNQRIDTALLLGVDAINIYDTYEARSSLLTSLESSPLLTRFLYDHDAPVRATAWHPRLNQFVTADAAGNLIFWDADTDLPIHELISAYDGAIWDISYSPDGTQLVSAGEDGNIRLWDTATFEPIGEPFGGLPDAIYCVAFSPNGLLLASGHGDNLVRLWDATNGTELAALENHEDWVYSVAFSPDGSLLASGGEDAIITIWNVENPEEAQITNTITEHSNAVWGLAFNPENTMLASGSADGTLRLWDVNDGTAVVQPLTDHIGWVRSVAFSHDGKLLASAGQDGRIILRDPQNGRRLSDVAPLRGHSGVIFDFAFSPDDGSIVSGDDEDKVLLWDVSRRKPLNRQLTDEAGEVYSLSYSPDGSQLLSTNAQGQAVVRNVADGQPTLDPFAAEFELFSSDISPDGKLLAYGVADGTVVVRDAASGQEHFSLKAHETVVRRLVFSQDSTILISAGDDGLIKIWNMKSGEQDGDSLTGDGAPVWAMALSPDGKTLASGDKDGNILLWDLAGRDLRSRYPVVQPNITSLVYSPDGSLLASGSRASTVILWNVATGQPRGLPLAAHTDWVLDLSFNPAGTILASSGRDSTIVLWDVATGQPIGQPLQSLNGWVWSVDFSPDGVTLASGSREGHIDLWIVSLAEWQRLACQIANRDLTETERDRYLFGGQASADCLSPES